MRALHAMHPRWILNALIAADSQELVYAGIKVDVED
jgi:hypothetical protein